MFNCCRHFLQYLGSSTCGITLLGKEKVGLFASRAFVCLSCTCYFSDFSLPLGGMGYLRFVNMVLP